jgi:hypothetical protein
MMKITSSVTATSTRLVTLFSAFIGRSVREWSPRRLVPIDAL